ncbi:transcription termination factor 4, mitochondrial [Scleropages formosus]|uniref:Mitochondrial transcription termination factor 4 n=1 Tax=Scleropages formosus TaxID=113540 RepID=A0A8C9R0M2_SCLFO|nr:transcription termination factor 4, mitochondrial [Scleropages formosus]
MLLRNCMQQRVFGLVWRTTPVHCCRHNVVIAGMHNGSWSIVSLRGMCSNPMQHHSVHPQQSSGWSLSEDPLPSLLHLGFTEGQARQLLYEQCKGHHGHKVTMHLCGVSTLISLGMRPSNILKILQKCPDLCRVKGVQMQQRVDNLRKLGLVEGSLQRVISYYPKLLTLTPKKVNVVCRFLQEKCLFTTQQVTEILRNFPATMVEDFEQLEYKFQYAYFRMGLRQAEMLQSGLFRVSLVDLHYRHSFLERRGQYQTPDKKGQTRIVNPRPKDVIGGSEYAFLSQVAKATQEEFRVFQKLILREQEEEEQQEEELSGDEEVEESGDG